MSSCWRRWWWPRSGNCWLLVAETVAVWLVRRWGPGSLKGVASPGEVERLLGHRRLYRVRKVVRPDLYGRLSRHEDQEAQDVTV